MTRCGETPRALPHWWFASCSLLPSHAVHIRPLLPVSTTSSREITRGTAAFHFVLPYFFCVYVCCCSWTEKKHRKRDEAMKRGETQVHGTTSARRLTEKHTQTHVGALSAASSSSLSLLRMLSSSLTKQQPSLLLTTKTEKTKAHTHTHTCTRRNPAVEAHDCAKWSACGEGKRKYESYSTKTDTHTHGCSGSSQSAYKE